MQYQNTFCIFIFALRPLQKIEPKELTRGQNFNILIEKETLIVWVLFSSEYFNSNMSKEVGNSNYSMKMLSYHFFFWKTICLEGL